MLLRTLVVGKLHTNSYLLASEETREALVIDPGGDEEVLLSALEVAQAQLRQIVLTHFHFDHILAAEPLRQATGAPLAIHKREAPYLKNPPALFRLYAPEIPAHVTVDQLLHDGDVLRVGELRLQVLDTPGHSPGGISLWLPEEKIVFSGDALFQEGVGRTDFPGSNHERLMESIHTRLFALPDETVVYPGHGPATTIEHERKHNPWIRPENRRPRY